MSETGHDLYALFPAQREILHSLKMGDAHFRQLADRHHDLVLAISRIEEGLEAAADDRLEDLKKHRLDVLDDIAAMISSKVVDDAQLIKRTH